MHAAQSLREGRPGQALVDLQEEVRKAPGDPKLRIFLFQVLAVLGQWDRALKQLQVAASLDAAAVPMAQAYREVIGCELWRAEVFAGRRAPSVLGEPPAWMAPLIKALELTANAQHAEAEALRAEALEQAEATSGKLNGEPFAWVADADSRFGPVLEVIIKGRYYLLPFVHVSALRLDAPTDLRDLVWAPAHVTLRTGTEVPAFIPARYPGSEQAEDEAVKLGRKTVWLEPAPGAFLGLGQRVITTDTSEVSLLELRSLELAEQVPADEQRPHA